MRDGVPVLVPTCGRPAALAATLATVAAQSHPRPQVVVSDQSDTPSFDWPEVAAVLRMPRALGREVATRHHLPRRGIAEPRAFLLAQLHVMARFGGCAIIPSGACHMELPTTVPVRDCDAPRVPWPRPAGMA